MASKWGDSASLLPPALSGSQLRRIFAPLHWGEKGEEAVGNFDSCMMMMIECAEEAPKQSKKKGKGGAGNPFGLLRLSMPLLKGKRFKGHTLIGQLSA